MKTAMSRLCTLVTLFALGACVQKDLEPRFTPAWEPFDQTREGWLKSRRILLVSDCQVHNLLSQSLPERNLSAEAAIATAIRPPQLDLFATDVLSWITTEGNSGADMILHLGDALDLACEGEFEAFLEVMEASGLPWLMAPGNHDFYYFGTYDPQDTELWDQACHRSGARLPKDRFIRLYVAALLRQDDPSLTAFAAALDLGDVAGLTLHEVADQVPDAFEWHARPDTDGVLAAICWSIDVEEPWRSFVVQQADTSLPGGGPLQMRALLLDSCQYQRRPILIPNAWQSYPISLNCGSTGQMLPDQLRKVREWIETAPEKTRFGLMCHHPFDDLEPHTKSSLGWLWREKRLGSLVTAHTHAGYFQHHDLGGPVDQLELNLGSTTDWPMEWRTTQTFVDIENHEIYVQTERHTLVDTLKHEEGFFQRGWEIPLEAPDDYRRYKQGQAASAIFVDFYLAHHLVPYWLPQPHIRPNAAARATEEQVKDTLLWTYFRLIREFPTDPTRGHTRWPTTCADDGQVVDRIVATANRQEDLDAKIDLLEELGRFEKTRRTRDAETGEPNDDVRARFKISQAAWASRFESSQGRRLSVEDELIRVDWATTTGQAK